MENIALAIRRNGFRSYVKDMKFVGNELVITIRSPFKIGLVLNHIIPNDYKTSATWKTIQTSRPAPAKGPKEKFKPKK